MVKISVIMPSLNVASYIEECISSVERQTLSDIEILCIDAGSTDGTLDILRNHADTDKRIRIIESDVKSYGYQVNLGIREARGEFIDIVETDDFIDDNMLMRLYSEAAGKKLDYIKSSYYGLFRIGNREIPVKCSELSRDDDITFGEVVNPKEHPELHSLDCYIWTGIYRRQFLLDENIRLNESAGAAFQDIGFVNTVLSVANKAIYLEEPLYWYRTCRADASTWNKNCVKYTKYEYAGLFDSQVISDEIFKIHRKYIDIQMARAFEGEISKVVSMCNDSFDFATISEPYEWFGNKMNQEISEGFFDYTMMKNEELAVKVKLLINNPQIYVVLVQTENDIRNQKETNLLNQISGRNIVIFGCGQRCNSLINLLFGNAGVNIDALTDNDETKWKTSLYGLSVVSPVKALADYADDYYVIANKAHGADIKKQLISMGVREDRIIVWMP